MYQTPQLKTRRKKQFNGALFEVSPPCVEIYYCASSLRNHSLFLIPHFELWYLSPAIRSRAQDSADIGHRAFRLVMSHFG